MYNNDILLLTNEITNILYNYIVFINFKYIYIPIEYNYL